MERRFAAVRARMAQKSRDEGGFTVPELAVAIAVSAIIAVAALAFVVVSSRQYANQQSRVTATDNARNGLTKMTSELRDATLVQIVDARTVNATIRNLDGSTSEIQFACAANGPLSACTRTDLSTSEAVELVDDVENADNFSTVSGSDLTGTGNLNGALRINLDVQLSDSASNPENPVNLVATVKPRNCVASPAEGVLNPPC